MKKAILLMMSCLFLLASTVWAEEKINVTANVDFQHTVQGTYNTTSTEAPNLLHTGKIDGSNIGTINAYWNKGDGGNDLPEYLAKQNWRIWKGTNWHENGIAVNELENLGSSWWDYSKWFRIISKPTGILPLESSNDILMPLSFWPTDAKRVSIAQIHVEKGSELVDETIADTWLSAWKNGERPKYFTVLYKITPISNAFIKALGAAATTGMAHGPEAEAGKRATSGAVGSGYGTASGLIWNGEDIMVIGWDQAPIKTQITKKIPTEIKMSDPLKFEYDSAEINTSEQLAIVNQHASVISREIKNLQPGEKIWIIGCASEEGTVKYNINLGRERALNEAELLAQILRQNYGLSTELIQEKLRFASIGEYFPDYKKIEDNRRTYILKAKKL